MSWFVVGKLVGGTVAGEIVPVDGGALSNLMEQVNVPDGGGADGESGRSLRQGSGSAGRLLPRSWAGGVRKGRRLRCGVYGFAQSDCSKTKNWQIWNIYMNQGIC